MDQPFPAYQGDEPYVFVCYAHDDGDVVYPELAWLQREGIHLWYDEGIPGGRVWRQAIHDALKSASRVLFYVSSSSIASGHCNREINVALDDDTEIVPVYLEDVELSGDLVIGLSRVQALRRDQDANYRQHLLRALGHSQVVETAQPFAEQSRRWWAVYAWVAGIVMLVIGGSGWYVRDPAPPPAVDEPSLALEAVMEPAAFDASIAILPIRASNTDPAVTDLADGLVDEIVGELSGARLEALRRYLPLLDRYGMSVAPATTARRYRDTTESSRSIGRTLGVAYLLDGSVRAGGGQFRVSLQLIRAADDEQVWTQIYDRPQGNPLDVQADIARHAAWSVTATIPNDYWYRSVRSVFADDAAHHYFVRAHRGTMGYLRGDDVDLVTIARNYEKSLELDPAFAETYVFLLLTYRELIRASIEPIETIAPIDELLSRLSALPTRTDDLTLSLANLRASQALLRLDYLDADRYLQQALSERPNDLGAHLMRGWLSVHRGDMGEARAAFRRATEAGGAVIPYVVRLRARTLRASDLPSEAVAFIERVLDLVPGDYGKATLLLDQAVAFASLGDVDRATERVDLAWMLSGSQRPEIFPAALAMTGRADRAVSILRQLEAEGSRSGVNPVDVIDAYVALDDLDNAFRWIEESIHAGNFDVVTWMHYSRTDRRLVDDVRWRQAWNRLPKVPRV